VATGTDCVASNSKKRQARIIYNYGAGEPFRSVHQFYLVAWYYHIEQTLRLISLGSVLLANMDQLPDLMNAIVFEGPYNVSVQKRPVPKCWLSSPEANKFAKVIPLIVFQYSKTAILSSRSLPPVYVARKHRH
jgi:hypothetical protein